MRADEAQFSRSLFRSQLSQTLRPTLAHLELDRFTASWQFGEGLTREAQALRPEVGAEAEAYARGFSAQQAGRPRWPWQRQEFPAAPWTVEDSALLVRTWGFFSWWELRADVVFFLLGLIQEGVSWNRLRDLFPELGDEPDRLPYLALERPEPLSPDAVRLLGRLRRWRPGVAVASPQWGVSLVSDVTEPGLPYLELCLDVAGDTWRGLSIAGIPGLMTGRNATLAWHLEPSWDDLVDFRWNQGEPVPRWVGAEAQATQGPGTLANVLETLGQPSVSALEQVWQQGGTAGLSVTASDTYGNHASWETGPRWARRHARDAWLPALVPTNLARESGKLRPKAGRSPLQAWILHQLSLPARGGYGDLAKLLVSPAPLQVATLLPQLRFLLPETDEAAALRTWSGDPPDGAEARLFLRLTKAVVRAFWRTAGLEPGERAPAVHWLWPAVDRLLATPHSHWLPSGDRNRILRQAVQEESEQTPVSDESEAPLERPCSPRLLYRETLGTQTRVFATVVAVTCDFSGPGLRVFQTDDESETPAFHDL